MKTRIVLGMFAAVLATACSRKKPEEGKEPSVAAPAPVPANPAGGGSGGSGTTAGSAAADEKLLARGEYVAKMFGCGVCHVGFGPTGPDFSKPFSGGMEVPEKFGTWRASNITPDKSSGIGNWKVEDVMAAVREGVRPDGTRLFPIMPYPNYNRMTDDDARALATFILSVKPIDHVVAPNKDLKLPQPQLPKPANAPDPVGDPVKHGEYLATNMHCNNCHAKPGKDGAPDFMGHPYSGGMEMVIPFLGEGSLYASNITSDKDTGIGKWSEADIAKALKTMTRPDGTVIQGPMQFYATGWSQLDDKDLDAVAAYVHQIPAEKNKVAKSTFKPRQPGPPPGASPTGPTGAAGSGNPSVPATPAGGGSGSAAGSAAPAAGSGSGSGSGSAKK